MNWADGKRAVRRALRPHRQRLEWLRRGAAVALFRGMVGLLRILRILPRGRRAAADVPASILIVHLTPHLGDSILLMPMIEALRAANPEARIECVVESSALPLLQAMSALDHAYGLRLHGPVGVTYWSSLQRAWEVARGYWLHLRALQPTVCLVPRWDNDLHRSAVLAYLIDAPRRVAFASDDNVWSRPAPYRDALFTQLVRGGSGLHEPVRLCLPAQLAGLIPDSALGAVSTGIVPSLAATAARQDWKLLSARTGIEPSEPFAVIAPGASAPNRIWPPERWLAVMHSLEAEGLHVVIMSGPQDVAVARQLHALGGGRATLLAGSTSLLESLSVVAHATIFLGNDSGPGHMAGALGVPSVILFSTGEATQIDGPSMPERIRPAGPGVRVVRPSRPAPPCTNLCECGTPHCILGVSTAQVLEAVRLVLQKR